MKGKLAPIGIIAMFIVVVMGSRGFSGQPAIAATTADGISWNAQDTVPQDTTKKKKKKDKKNRDTSNLPKPDTFQTFRP
ncbi:hypothetical protein [Chitinophaga alhagiae]|uniref:hypothetical protein n=1 Tax=Chitinophaga alhagiae TaxID=2203219 RepID=UPI000E5C3D4C|nr:hypothetical protein [Chitinophaga alhagiae]